MAVPTLERKKRKRWYTVMATKDFQEMPLGEVLAADSSGLVGRQLHLNLMTLTNDPRKQSVTLSFRIDHMRGDVGVAAMVGYKLHMSHLKRFVRKASNKLEESYSFLTKDNVRCRIKPLLLTRFRANRSTLTRLRKATQEYIAQFFQQHTFADIFLALISNKLQMDLKSALKKVYPLSTSEVKVFYKEQAAPVPAPQSI